jgi:hypothetical protein
VIDHPFLGKVVEEQCLMPFDERIPEVQSILPVLGKARVRPRVAGFVEFQTAAAEIIWRYLRKPPTRQTLASLHEARQQSLIDRGREQGS